MEHIANILNLLNSSYSTFHVVNNIEKKLQEASFKKISEKDLFKIEKGGKYYLTRNDSSVIAFKIPEVLNIQDLSFLISATHNDSPTFKLKPNPIINVNNLLLLETEPYGGGIYNTWLDKPLSIAGRVLVNNNGTIQSKLFCIDEDLLIIPNVCIHMNREINKSNSYNASVDLRPIFSTYEENFSFDKYLLDKLSLNEGEVLSHDLFLYNREKATLIGKNKEFLASGRLDDLASTYSALLGFIESESSDHISLFASFDNEEVGSLTKQGANSDFLKWTIRRILKGLNIEDEEMVYSKSFLLSIDNAHANHPNHLEYSAKTCNVLLNNGIVIKYNANQSYTSDGFSSSIVKMICVNNNLKYQEYTNRSDLRGGSTLGNLSNSELSLTSCDIGIAQLAMHSSYEMLGKYDIEDMIKLTKSYFSSFISYSDEGVKIE